VKDLEIAGLRTTPAAGAPPVIRLVQTSQAFLYNCSAPPGTETFLDVHGGRTERVVLMNCNLGGVGEPAQVAPEVPPGALTLAGNAV
jgi:hypothetical protein